jgi:ankyrin repeat protein
MPPIENWRIAANNSPNPTTDLLIAAEENNVEHARAAIANGADVNGIHNIMTPLILACRNNSIDIILLLLSNPDVRINEELVSPDGRVRQNALDVAVLENQDDYLVEYLLEHGAVPIHDFIREHPVYLSARYSIDDNHGGRRHRRTRKGRKTKKARKSRRMHKKSRRI